MVVDTLVRLSSTWGGSDVDRANQGHKVECRMLAGPDVANYKSYLRPLNLNFHGSSTFAKQSYSRQIRVNFRRGCVFKLGGK